MFIYKNLIPSSVMLIEIDILLLLEEFFSSVYIFLRGGGVICELAQCTTSFHIEYVLFTGIYDLLDSR